MLLGKEGGRLNKVKNMQASGLSPVYPAGTLKFNINL